MGNTYLCALDAVCLTLCLACSNRCVRMWLLFKRTVYVTGYTTGYSKASPGTTQSSAEVAERRRCYDNGVWDVSHPVTSPENQRWGEERVREHTGESRCSNFVMAYYENVFCLMCQCFAHWNCFVFSPVFFFQVQTLWFVTRGTSCAMKHPISPKPWMPSRPDEEWC